VTAPAQNLHNKGWGFALFIIALAIVTNLAVYSLHKATYLMPDAHAASEAAH
jgi:hypothetical protein